MKHLLLSTSLFFFELNLFPKQEKSHRYKKQTYSFQGGKKWGINWELGTDIYVLSHFGCVQHFLTLWMAAHQAPLSMGFSRQEYWSRLPCLPDPGIKPTSSMAPVLQADSLLLTHRGSPKDLLYSTGNSTLYSLMAYMGKESKR